MPSAVWRRVALTLSLGCCLPSIAAASSASDGSFGDALNAPEPPGSPTGSIESDLFDITINGEPQGEGAALEVERALYIDVAMAQTANLLCGRQVVRGGRTLCAIPAVRVARSGRKVEVTVPVTAFRRARFSGTPEPKRIPEIPPSRLGFINYDLSGSVLSGQAAFTGGLRGGLRFDENALDIGGVVTHSAAGGASIGTNQTLWALGTGATQVTVTDLAYRRNWFDERLSLTAGRTSFLQRGFLSAGLFDGIGLMRQNLDDQGYVRASQSLPLTGYNPTAGVLTYRVGTNVLKQVPLAAGPYTIDPSMFSSLPGGGHIEITGYDGRVTSLDLPMSATRPQVIFKPGTWDANLQIGRMITTGGGFAAALDMGSRYGVSDALSVEGALVATRHSAALDASADLRLPYDLGVIGATGAIQWRRRNPAIDASLQQAQGWSLSAYYERKFGRLTLGADYQRNGDGGILAGGYDGIDRRRYDYLSAIGVTGSNPLLLLGSSITEDYQVYASSQIAHTGISGTLRWRSTAYVSQPGRTRYIEAQLGGGLGRFGTWGVYTRAGRDGYDHSTVSGNVFWMVPLGGRTSATLSYQTDRSDGARTQPDRYVLTVNGSTSGHWSQANTYSASVDSQGYGSLAYNREFAQTSLNGSAFRSPQTGANGTLGARGSIAFADAHVVFGKSTNDTLLVLNAPDLPRQDVYLGGYSDPITRTDGAGFAILPSPQPYRPLRARVNDQDAPLGLEVPDNVLAGSVQPYRGYVVRVKTHLARPVRLMLDLAADVTASGPYADVAGLSIPVEPDGSLYVEDAGRVTRDIVVEWPVGDATRACTVARSVLGQAAAGGGDGAIQRIAHVACTPSAPRSADPGPATPVETPGRIPPARSLPPSGADAAIGAAASPTLPAAIASAVSTKGP